MLFVENMSFWINFFESIGRKNLKLLNEKIEGEFIQGGFGVKDKIIVIHKNTTITVDTRKRLRGKRLVLYYRIICPFKSINGLTFTISTEDAFSHAAKVFGYEDIKIGNEKFDNEFYLKANDRERFFEFMKSENLQNQYLKSLKKMSYSAFCIEIKGGFEYAVCNETNHSDIETILEYLNLCKLTLDRLIEIGEAEDISPDIQ
jgi:hypothetical protein